MPAPKTPGDYRRMVNTDAPLTEWSRYDSYYNARACERQREIGIMQLQEDLDEARARWADRDEDDPLPPGHSPTYLELWLTQVELSRCVPIEYVEAPGGKKKDDAPGAAK